MSRSVIFQIGAVVFVAVAAAVFLYGFVVFGSFEKPDDEVTLQLEHRADGFGEIEAQPRLPRPV